jgi:hypothetical protein
MGFKVGRNDLCPCGSGKKYKKCCLLSEIIDTSINTITDTKWRRLRQVEGIVVDKYLSNYLLTEIPNEIVEKADAEFFHIDLPEEANIEQIRDRLFLPWFFYHWIPSHDFGVKNFRSGITIAQNYVEAHRDEIPNEELSFIEAAIDSHYSFYSVLEVEVGKSLFVKDILLGTTHTLKERQGTFLIKRGDIIFSRILTLDDQSIAISMSPYLVPTKYHTDIIDFRDMLIKKNAVKALSSKILRGDDGLLVLTFFLKTLAEVLNPSPPILMNTDEELIVFIKSYFDLSMELEEVVTRLAPLSCTMELDEILEEAERDESGKIKRVEFSWGKKDNNKHWDWDNTILGNLEIENGTLVLDVNSRERAERGRALLQKYLGDKIFFQKSVIETQEQKLQEIKLSGFQKNASLEQAIDKLNETKEIQEIIRSMAKIHWENWFHEQLPVLGGKTPLQAARSKSGRERLEALLLMFERDAVGGRNAAFEPDIEYLRKKLRLNSER